MLHAFQELKGVSLQLLWQEYKEEYSEGYQYSQFCEYYCRWKKNQVKPSMQSKYTGGAQMQEGYAGVVSFLIMSLHPGTQICL